MYILIVNIVVATFLSYDLLYVIALWRAGAMPVEEILNGGGPTTFVLGLIELRV